MAFATIERSNSSDKQTKKLTYTQLIRRHHTPHLISERYYYIQILKTCIQMFVLVNQDYQFCNRSDICCLFAILDNTNVDCSHSLITVTEKKGEKCYYRHAAQKVIS